MEQLRQQVIAELAKQKGTFAVAFKDLITGNKKMNMIHFMLQAH